MLLLALPILIFFNVSIFQKEELIASAETIYLALAPVDPRSLIQGDYMVLRYEIEDAVSRAYYQLYEPESVSERSAVIITLDDQQRGTFYGFRKFDDATSLTNEQRKIIVKIDENNRVRLGINDFFFQEGHASFYEVARYAIVKLDRAGNLHLTGLADEDRNLIQPEELK